MASCSIWGDLLKKLGKLVGKRRRRHLRRQLGKDRKNGQGSGEEEPPSETVIKKISTREWKGSSSSEPAKRAHNKEDLSSHRLEKKMSRNQNEEVDARRA